MATATTSTDEIRSLILWARGQGVRLDEIELGGVRLKLADLRLDVGASQQTVPRTLHGLLSAQLGGPPEPEDDDEDAEARS